MRFLFGFLAALVVLSLQALDTGQGVEFTGTFAWRTALSQAVGLSAVALLAAAAPGRATQGSGAPVLLGLVCGASVQALLLGWRLPLPIGHGALAACATVAAAVAAFLCVLRRVDEPADAPRGLGLLALALAAAGASLSLQGIGRITLRLGLGSPQEFDWLVAVGLLAAAGGGLAFGRFLAGFEQDRARGATAALALAGTGIGTWIASRAALLVVSPRGLRTLVRRFGFDIADSGTLPFGAVTGMTLLLVPAFFAGTALYAARGRRALVTIAMGAAFGPLIANVLLASAGPTDLLSGSGSPAGSTRLVQVGCWICAAATLLVLLPGSGARALGRAWGLTTIATTAAALLIAGLPAIPVLRAWSRFPVDPRAVLETPEGQIVIEPAGGTGLRAVLDQRPLTLGPPGLDMDRAQLESALDVLDPRVLVRGAKLLLIGQLDQQRMELLVRNGVTRVDRTASWWAAMEQVEQALGLTQALIPGSVLSPTDASAAWATGEYDLVLALARPLIAPRSVVANTLHPETRAVYWMDASASLAASDLGNSVLLTSTGLQDYALGVADPAARDAGSRLIAGKPLGTLLPARTLLRREWERPNPQRARLLSRLAHWNPEAEDWLNNLARLSAVQGLQSPFESYAQSLVLDEQLVRDMCQQAAPLGEHRWVRRVMEGLATVLADRRDVSLLLEALAPLSEAWNRPPQLEAPLAQGDLESLQPAAAIARLEPLAEFNRPYPPVLRLLGEAHYQLGSYEKAAEAWRTLQKQAGLNEFHTRRLALALLRSGDPEGAYQVRLLLALHPEDEELSAALEAGPLAPGDPSYQPEGDAHDH